MRRLAIIGGLFGLLTLTAGCAELAATAAGQIATTAVNQIAAAAVDERMSSILGKDCNSYRFVREGTYCVDDDPPVDPGPPLYCVKTLGGIECYDQPDPYAVAESGRTNQPQALRSPNYEVAKQQAEAQRSARQKSREARRTPQSPPESGDEERKAAPQWVTDGLDI